MSGFINFKLSLGGPKESYAFSKTCASVGAEYSVRKRTLRHASFLGALGTYPKDCAANTHFLVTCWAFFDTQGGRFAFMIGIMY